MRRKNLFHALLLTLFALTSTIVALGQNADLRPTREMRETRRLESQDNMANSDQRRRIEAQRRSGNNSPIAPQPEKYKLSSEDKALLAPAADDETTYASFLQQPNTGIFRLFPLQVTDGRVVSAKDTEAKKPKVLTNGVGSLYSFTKARYGLDERTEVLFHEGELKVGVSPERLGMLVSLGKVPLESVTLSSPGVAELAGFTPPTLYSAAVEQHTRNAGGFKIGSQVYRASLPAKVDTTYALRSINYGKSDAIIALRVVRKGDDGGITILWKMIGTYPTQTLKGKP